MQLIKKGIAGAIITITVFGSGYWLYHTNYPIQFFSCLAYPALKINHFIESLRPKVPSGEIASLQHQLTVLQMQNVRLRAALSFAQDIKDLHVFNQRYQGRGTIAQVIARHITADAHYYLIDAGTDKNITKDMIVLHNNNLVGKVIEVFPWYSKVALITDRHCKVASYCYQTHAHGIAEGENVHNRLTLRYVDHLAQIADGDTVFSSGQGLVFPAGFALGTVKEHAQEGLYKTVIIEPMSNFDEIAYCLVMAK